MYASRNRFLRLTTLTLKRSKNEVNKPKNPVEQINIFQNLSDDELHQKPKKQLPRHEDLAPPPTLTPEITSNPKFSVKQQFPTPTFDKTKITTNAVDLTKFNSLPEPVYTDPVLQCVQKFVSGW